MSLDRDTKRLLDDVKLRLQRLYGARLVDIVLYGSVARGEDHPGSDVDVLVVLRGPLDRHQENGRLAEIVVDLMEQYSRPLSPVVMDDRTFLSGDWPLLRNVRDEGVSL